MIAMMQQKPENASEDQGQKYRAAKQMKGVHAVHQPIVYKHRNGDYRAGINPTEMKLVAADGVDKQGIGDRTQKRIG